MLFAREKNNLLSCADCVCESHTCLCIAVCGFACTPTLIQPHTNLTSTLSPSRPHSAHGRADTHSHSNSTLSWFINEEIARGDGKRRLDDLRVIEVDAREDEKCVCACVLCLCAFEGRIEANGWDDEKWDWTSREIFIRAACVPSCSWEGVRSRAGGWTAQRTAVLLCLIKPMLRISSRPPHRSSSSSRSAVNMPGTHYRASLSVCLIVSSQHWFPEPPLPQRQLSHHGLTELNLYISSHCHTGFPTYLCLVLPLYSWICSFVGLPLPFF